MSKSGCPNRDKGCASYLFMLDISVTTQAFYTIKKTKKQSNLICLWLPLKVRNCLTTPKKKH